MVAGMGAGVVESVFAVTPSERIKTALISDAKGAKRFRNGAHASRIIFMEKGVRGFYQGLLATTLKQSATSAVRMGTYSALKEEWRARGLPASSAATFGIGVVAGIVTVYATQPFDTVKTRTQSSVGASTKEAVCSVVGESGVTGLWKGSTMRLGRLMFSGGIVFTIYEKVSSLLSGS
jgi:solute carrier family 25 citrate transporter 1